MFTLVQNFRGEDESKLAVLLTDVKTGEALHLPFITHHWFVQTNLVKTRSKTTSSTKKETQRMDI